jgi:biopolymer transport protein ExbD
VGAKLSGGGGKYTVDQNSDMNVTPFVDVMLVLLIIFMVSAPLATVSIHLDFPPPSRVPVDVKEDPVFLSVYPDGSIYIAAKRTSPENLPIDLAAALGGTDPTSKQVFIRAEPDVLYGQFMDVMNLLQDNGYFKVGLIGEDIS